MNLKQAILSSFGRDDLKSLLDEIGIDGVDRRSVDAMRVKLSRSRSVSVESLLGGVRKDKIVHEVLHLKVLNHGKVFRAPLKTYLGKTSVSIRRSIPEVTRSST